ncbi:MAG: SDR family oxidoreductase [Actinobacteria bacterium]|nr:SDR family oxidoreductase [Actinomycetota bacterium]
MDTSMFDLTGKVALVTGASRGIGEAIALAYSRFGARLVLASRKLEALEAVRKNIEAQNAKAICVPTHVGSLEALSELIEKTMDEYGRLDVLVNNAGIVPATGPPEDVDEQLWNKIMDVNLKGSFFLANSAAEAMRGNGGGSIINVSTYATRRPTPGLGVYIMSKAAVDMMTKVLAQEWTGAGIRVNGIAPGLIRTSITKTLWENEKAREAVESKVPIGRIGEPDDISGAAVFLASDASKYISGETILVDGGLAIGLSPV